MISMQPDDELCLCFNVSKRKVVNFLRIERPTRPGQLAECFGAGTGCGWCRPYLEQLFEELGREEGSQVSLPSSEDYTRLRAQYLGQAKESE